MLIINCKNYLEVATESRLKKLIDDAAHVSAKHGTAMAIAPPQHLIGSALRYVADIKASRSGTKSRGGHNNNNNQAIPAILAQHVDLANAGSTTGYVVPEMLKKAGVAGSIINHSEHRISPAELRGTVARLCELNLMSVLCVKNVAEANRYAKINPDYIAIEPPELIGSGKAVSTEKPELISNAAKSVSPYRTKLLCGAGIISGTDVEKSACLGASGILVASGVIKNPTRWRGIMSDLAKPLVKLR